MSALFLCRRTARLQRDAEMWEVAVRRGAGVSMMACGLAASEGDSDRVSAAGALRRL